MLIEKSENLSNIDDNGKVKDSLPNAYGEILMEFLHNFKDADSSSEVFFSSLARVFSSVIGYKIEKSNFAVFLFEKVALGEKLEVACFESETMTIGEYEPILSATEEMLTNGIANSPTKISKKQLSQFVSGVELLPSATLVVPIRSSYADYGYVAIFCHGSAGRFAKDSPQLDFINALMQLVALYCKSKKSEVLFEYYLMNDHLTELPNRAHIYEAIIYQLQMAGVFGSRFAILMVKVNGIKHINDSLGITTGDMALKEIGTMIKSAVSNPEALSEGGSEVLVGRLSGNDFIVLVDTLAQDDINEQVDTEIVESICKSIIAKTINSLEVNGHKLYLTANIGASIYPYHGETAEELLRKADLAKSASKADGPRSYKVYENFMDGDADKRLFLNSNLPVAISSNQFELFYQAQVVASTRELIGAEALIRWRHPERGMIPPGDFIDFAERNAYAIQIDNLVLDMACDQILKWQEKDFRPILSVNISSKHFENGLICDTLNRVLIRTGVKGSQLKIELLESVLIDDFDGTVKVIKDLREQLGVRVALDDFGAGYSSLEYVAMLPLDYLKIDRSFVMNLEKNASNEILLETIMTLAKGMKVKTIAEGVENDNQLQFLSKIGCDLVQGYYINRPMDADSFDEKFLKPEVK